MAGFERPDPGSVLSRRALNRAFLARQLLLERRPMPAAAALEHLVGLQAQAPQAPYVGLWSWLEAFDPEELAGLIERRAAVRIALLRSTIFLVTAPDALALRGVLQPVLVRSLMGNFRRGLEGVDLAAVAAEGRRLVDEAPRTFSELASELGPRWPGADPQALAMAVRSYVPLVQVPPRGLWGRRGPARHAAMETWVGCPIPSAGPAGGPTPTGEPGPGPGGPGGPRPPRPPVPEPAGAAESMLVRYLRAFGPAAPADLRVWSGLPGLREALERLRPRLATYRDEQGSELLDLPGAPLPDPATPVPVRFLPEYDNALLSHADRERIIAPDHREALFTRGAVLVDGFVHGAWTIRTARGEATLDVEPFAPLSAARGREVRSEAERLLAFAGAAARKRRLVLRPS
jgi:hypothetical protein